MPKRNKKPRKRPPASPFKVGNQDLPVTSRPLVYPLLVARDYETICRGIVDVLDYFQRVQFQAFSARARHQLNEFVSAVFTIFSDSDFTIPQNWVVPLLSRAHLFANVVALSNYETTDAVLRQISSQPGCFTRLLFLYTARNSIEVPPNTFFDINDKLASLWHFTYPLPSVGCCTPLLEKNLRGHYLNADPRYRPFDHRVAIPYFYSTYFAGRERADRTIKQRINTACQDTLAAAGVRVDNNPQPDSIAIVTSKWFPNSAVHKSCGPLVSQLREKYRLTLIHAGGGEPSQFAKDTFADIRRVYFFQDKQGRHNLHLDPVLSNDFQLVYYPDIGMTDESIWLSNLRLAPIQATSYGHPVSTFGSLVDYFIVGEDVEVREDFEKNYSEVPVVIPGDACTPTWPNYHRKNLPKKSERTVVNCVWGPEKYNHTLLTWLKEVADASSCEFAIFPGPSARRYNAYLPFVAEVRQVLGDRATIHADKEYLDYMEEAEYGDFSINSYPFGGYNTVVESLYLGKPVVTLEGDRFYNRVASYLLRQVGLEHLIAETPRQFVTLCSLMASDPGFLAAQKEILAAADLKATLFKGTDPNIFVEAIDYLIENHSNLQATPVRSIQLP